MVVGWLLITLHLSILFGLKKIQMNPGSYKSDNLQLIGNIMKIFAETCLSVKTKNHDIYGLV